MVFSLGQAGTLQWGRNLTVAEGIVMLPLSFFLFPLQWGRNLTVAEGTWPRRGLTGMLSASMGPQLDSCGRCAITGCVFAQMYCFNGAAT